MEIHIITNSWLIILNNILNWNYKKKNKKTKAEQNHLNEFPSSKKKVDLLCVENEWISILLLLFLQSNKGRKLYVICIPLNAPCGAAIYMIAFVPHTIPWLCLTFNLRDNIARRRKQSYFSRIKFIYSVVWDASPGGGGLMRQTKQSNHRSLWFYFLLPTSICCACTNTRTWCPSPSVVEVFQ